MNNKHLSISPEVAAAISKGKAVVALESTIISHGMPYPKNVETALQVEEEVRKGGAIPATIAILNGTLKVGLSKDEIDYLGKKGLSCHKVSRRDMAYVLANGSDGATTVSGTMIAASIAGIKIFATGGIGGVHRGATETFDISADLEELSKTPVMVICAGAKSILDLPLTMEYLETKGVPVIGYGTKELPAFFTKHSGISLEQMADSPGELAKIYHMGETLGLKNGYVVTNPISDEFSMNEDYITSKISEALKECEEKGIKGKDTTPYLLDKIVQITEGKSLEANIKLVLSNASLAAKVAKELENFKD